MSNQPTFVRRLKWSILLPRDPGVRAALLAQRAGLVQSDVQLSGYDNRFTRWCWLRYINLFPSEHEGVIAYLLLLKEHLRRSESE